MKERKLKRNPAGIAFVTLVFATVLTVSCGQEPVNETTYAIDVEGEGNEVIAEPEEEGAVFEVFSDRGIGAASVAVDSGEIPSSVTLDFLLGGLEELRFSYGATEVLVSVSSSQGNAVRQSVIRGSGESRLENPITPESPYWMEVVILEEDGSPGTIPLAGGVILVSAPEDFTQGANDAFRFQWIDFYR